jgi:hypothetical protein
MAWIIWAAPDSYHLFCTFVCSQTGSTIPFPIFQFFNFPIFQFFSALPRLLFCIVRSLQTPPFSTTPDIAIMIVMARHLFVSGSFFLSFFLS